MILQRSSTAYARDRFTVQFAMAVNVSLVKPIVHMLIILVIAALRADPNILLEPVAPR